MDTAISAALHRLDCPSRKDRPTLAGPTYGAYHYFDHNSDSTILPITTHTRQIHRSIPYFTAVTHDKPLTPPKRPRNPEKEPPPRLTSHSSFYIIIKTTTTFLSPLPIWLHFRTLLWSPNFKCRQYTEIYYTTSIIALINIYCK